MLKVHELLAREGTVVPERTLHRYADEVCDVGRGRRGTTVRVNDGKPGDESLCGFPHRDSYVESANMRRPRAPMRCLLVLQALGRFESKDVVYER